MKHKDNNRVADIAKIVGVSSSTVSNALNNRKGVSGEKKQEILKIAKEMGYERNVRKRADATLRFVIFKRHGAVVDDTPFFSQLIKGIETESKKFGYNLIVTHMNVREFEDDDSLEKFKSDSSEGIIVLATELIAADLQYFKSVEVPIVMLDSCFRGESLDCVTINNEDGIYQATKYLIDNGHRKIGLLHSANYISNFYYRRKSFYTTMSDSGLSVDPSHEVHLTSTMEGAYKDMKAYLSGAKGELPEAYVAENDIIAIGAMRALNEAGVRIPKDISIIGFDDMPFCDVCTPRLSTIQVEKEAMGKLAVQTLVGKIKGTHTLPIKIQACTKLIERESVRRIENAPELPAGEMLRIV